jgi:hypothetical protein
VLGFFDHQQQDRGADQDELDVAAVLVQGPAQASVSLGQPIRTLCPSTTAARRDES